jgi:hypothetical protein
MHIIVDIPNLETRKLHVAIDELQHFRVHCMREVLLSSAMLERVDQSINRPSTDIQWSKFIMTLTCEYIQSNRQLRTNR